MRSGVTLMVGQMCLSFRLDASFCKLLGTLSLGGPILGIITLSTLTSSSIFKKSAWSWSNSLWIRFGFFASARSSNSSAVSATAESSFSVLAATPRSRAEALDGRDFSFLILFGLCFIVDCLSFDFAFGKPWLDPTAGTFSCRSNSLFFLLQKISTISLI